MSEESVRDEIVAYGRLVIDIRRELLKYISKLAKFSKEWYKDLNVMGLRDYVGTLSLNNMPNYESYVAVDGASFMLNLMIGIIGLYAIIAIKFPEIKRIYYSDSFGVIPVVERVQDVSDTLTFSRILDLSREIAFLRTCIKLVREYELDLIVLDGSLLPVPKTGLEDKHELLNILYRKYTEYMLTLHETCRRKGIPLVGFVKRVRSKFLTEKTSYVEVMLADEIREILSQQHQVYDNLLAEFFLKFKEYFPKVLPTVRYKDLPNLSTSFVLVKTSRSLPPYRVDFGGALVSGNRVDEDECLRALNFLCRETTTEGIPYCILKVDEEVKLSRALMSDLYDDIVHKYFKEAGDFSFVLTLWGESL